MRKSMICGCGGSGKSALSSKLDDHFGLPVTLLDMEYYDEQWNALDDETFAQRQRELVADDDWIIDGNYSGTMSIRLTAADTVIFLDIHPLICLFGILQRRFQHRGDDELSRHRRGRITWGFVKYILGFRKTMCPRVEGLISEHATGHVVRLRSRRAVRRYLAELTSSSARA